MSAGAAAGAAAAAAAMEAQRREEEERLTNYTKEDLTEGWEFKIVRSNFSLKNDRFRSLCEEEAQNGWELVEKFDSTRVRFKRPISAREQDKYATIDPYRTSFTKGDTKMWTIIFGSIAFFTALIFVLIFTLL